MFFLEKIKNIVKMEAILKQNKGNIDVLKQVKKQGFSDKYIAKVWKKTEEEIYNLRKQEKIYPVYKMIDTCSSEFESYVPYFYSTYEEENESMSSSNLVDYNNDNYYFSKDVSNSFVCFDFKDKSVKLSSYSIKSHNDGKNYAHLKNWVIEVSDDAKSWKIIDNQKNCSLLNGSNLVANFKIDKKDDDDGKFYRYVRIRSSGNSWYQYGNHSQIYFSLIEFYGQIKSDD